MHILIIIIIIERPLPVLTENKKNPPHMEKILRVIQAFFLKNLLSGIR